MQNSDTLFPPTVSPIDREEWASTEANLFLALTSNLACARYANYVRQCGSVIPPNECLTLAVKRCESLNWGRDVLREGLDHICSRNRTDGMLATFNPKFVAPLTCTSDAASAKIDFEEMWDHFLAAMYIKSEAPNQIALTDVLERKQFLSTNMMMMIPLSTIKILQLPIMAHQFWLESWVFSEDGEFDLRAQHLSLSINECSGARLRKPSRRFNGHSITVFEKVLLLLDLIEEEINNPNPSDDSESELPNSAPLTPRCIADDDHEALKVVQYRPYDSVIGFTTYMFYSTPATVSSNEAWPGFHTLNAVKLYRRTNCSLMTHLEEGRLKDFYVQTMVPAEIPHCIVSHAENLRCAISTAYNIGSIIAGSSDPSYIAETVQLARNWIREWNEGETAEKLDKIFTHYLPLFIQNEKVVTQNDRMQIEVHALVVSIFISMTFHSDNPEDEWAVHDNAIYRLKSGEFEPHTRVVAFKKLAEVLDDPELEYELEDFRRECEPCAFLIPNENMMYRLPPEAYGIEGTMLGYDFTYTNAPRGILFDDDDTDGDEEPETSATVEDLDEKTVSGDQNEQDDEQQPAQTFGGVGVGDPAHQINGDQSNEIEYLENRTITTHAAPSLPKYSALDEDSYAGCVAVKRRQTTSIPSVLNERWCRTRVICGDLSGITVHVRLEENGIHTATVDAREASGFREREALTPNAQNGREFYPSLEMLGLHDVPLDELLRREAFDVPLAPVVNMLLGGFCGLKPAKWILCAIYTGVVKVSKSSRVSYIPQVLRFDAKNAIEVTCPLSGEVVGTMGVLAPISSGLGIEHGSKNRNGKTRMDIELLTRNQESREPVEGKDTYLELSTELPLVKLERVRGGLSCRATTEVPDPRIFFKGAVKFLRPLY